MLDKSRSRQYINKQMMRASRIVKWAVGEGMMPPEFHVAIKCVDPLKRGRCEVRESKRISCVPDDLVDATLPHLTQVQADMVRFQRLTGCRPGELCKIKPGMVDRSGEVWEIRLEDHKTTYRGKERTIYVGPQAQAILKPYLVRAVDAYCFSPIESEKQRRQMRHAARKTPRSCGNVPGSNVARTPRKQPGECWTTQSYARAIRYACERVKLQVWSPNQLRHSAATEIRRKFGLDAAGVILGHTDIGVTQVYAEQDRHKAIDIAAKIG
jgi:integrase